MSVATLLLHRHRHALVLTFALAALGASNTAPAPGPTRLSLSGEFRVAVERGRDVFLEVYPHGGGGWHDLADRVCSDGGRAEDLQAANNDGGSARIPDDRWIRVPLDCLTRDMRALVLRALFPEDRATPDGWVHVAQSGRLPTFDEGLWQVAEWFTGEGDRFAELASVNAVGSPELRRGQEVLVPAALLHPAFAPRPASEDGLLTYDRDDQGDYAAYRLRPGEALYSAVVMRFTGRTRSDDVTEMADLLKSRSGIRDLTDIPAGYTIKIPFDALEPRYLPSDHPRRIAAETTRAEVEAELARAASRPAGRGLEGVLVVIDPGHGGQDLGTQHHGIWEHDHVYDIACRLRKRLEENTRAQVRMTLIDPDTGCEPSEKIRANRAGAVQTRPPFTVANKGNGETRISANLRWYLANSVYRDALARGVDRDRIVFMSLHADARHPNLRGLMVYLPGAALRTGREGFNSPTYRRFEEVRDKPYVSFSKRSRIHSEAVSRRLGRHIVDAFRADGLPVAHREPLRDKVVRSKNRRYVPAVIRGNQIPTKVLVEVLNLRSREDARMMGRAERRQEIADALADALFAHFGEDPPPSP